MIRLLIVYTILLIVNSCSNNESERVWLTVQPLPYSLPIDSIPNGSKIQFGDIAFDFPLDTIGHIKATDSVVTIKYGDSVSFIAVRQDPFFLLKMLKKQAESNNKLNSLIEEGKLKNDLDLYNYIYEAKPNIKDLRKEVLLDIKDLIMPSGSENGILKLNSSVLQGYQYCVGEKCKSISYDIFINNESYKIISKGFSQEQLDKILGSFTYNVTNTSVVPGM